MQEIAKICLILSSRYNHKINIQIKAEKVVSFMWFLKGKTEEEKQNKKLVRSIRKLSLTGRMCYLFMCIEKYLIMLYPQKDWTPVAKRCWQWTKRYWNEGWDIYSVVVPEFLFEFDTYEKANKEFDEQLSEKDYYELMNLFQGITDGNAEDEINQVLKMPINFSNECEGTDFGTASVSSMYLFLDMKHIFDLHNIMLPDISMISNMTMDQKNGWGEFVDSEYLSIILNT